MLCLFDMYVFRVLNQKMIKQSDHEQWRICNSLYKPVSCSAVCHAVGNALLNIKYELR